VGTLVWSLKLEGSGSCDLDINWNPFGGTGTRTGLWNSHFVRTKIRIGTLIKIYIEHRFRFFRSVEAEHFSKVDK
jgi:hypothetical protein